MVAPSGCVLYFPKKAGRAEVTFNPTETAYMERSFVVPDILHDINFWLGFIRPLNGLLAIKLKKKKNQIIKVAKRVDNQYDSATAL